MELTTLNPPTDQDGPLKPLLVALLFAKRDISIDNAWTAVKATGRKVSREALVLALEELDDFVADWENFPFTIRQVDTTFSLFPKSPDVAAIAGLVHKYSALTKTETELLILAILTRERGGFSHSSLSGRFDLIEAHEDLTPNRAATTSLQSLQILKDFNLVYTQKRGNGTYYIATRFGLAHFGLRKWSDFPGYEEFSSSFVESGGSLVASPSADLKVQEIIEKERDFIKA